MRAARGGQRGYAVGLLLLLAALAGCALWPPPWADPRAELAPTGTLRAAMALGDAATPSLAVRDPASGAPRGVPVDLAVELGRRLGVPVEIVLHASPSRIVEFAAAGAWDVGFITADVADQAQVLASQPYATTASTFLVPPGGPVASMADVDRAGVRVAVVQGSPEDRALASLLVRATLVRAATGPAALGLLADGRADALSASRSLLLTAAAALPGSRVLDGAFATLAHVAVVPRARRSALGHLADLVEALKASSAVAAALEAAGLRGVTVPPPIPR